MVPIECIYIRYFCCHRSSKDPAMFDTDLCQKLEENQSIAYEKLQSVGFYVFMWWWTRMLTRQLLAVHTAFLLRYNFWGEKMRERQSFAIYMYCKVYMSTPGRAIQQGMMLGTRQRGWPKTMGGWCGEMDRLALVSSSHENTGWTFCWRKEISCCRLKFSWWGNQMLCYIYVHLILYLYLFGKRNNTRHNWRKKKKRQAQNQMDW